MGTFQEEVVDDKRIDSEERIKTKQDKKKEKKEKKKQQIFTTNTPEESISTDLGHANDFNSAEKTKKKRKLDKGTKSKKKKKHKKNLRDENDDKTDAQRIIHHETKEEIMDRHQKAEREALTGDNNNNASTSIAGRAVVESSAIEFYDPAVIKTATAQAQETTRSDTFDQTKGDGKIDPVLAARKRDHSLTLLLFYQYVEPVWDESTYEYMLKTLQKVGTDLELTGRMRVAREGLNCTLTASHSAILEYCNTLRRLRPKEFQNTEFKLTKDLPLAQKFPNLKVFKVVELVHYGLEGAKAPPITKYHGTHLEPKEYHKKLAEPNTVIIDVRNHYEAAIGRFVPPQEGVTNRNSNKNSETDLPPPKWIDPKMRKSTEFPPWLDKPETREEMKGKQVLMYCTGGIRCERASALLKYKMETDPEIKALGIKGVYQLQGGIDKYFKEFPDGGYWQGKNYVFDKRFAHAPPKIDGELHGKKEKLDSGTDREQEQHDDQCAKQSSKTPPGGAAAVQVMGKCEACSKPWDMYRGKRRCPTCGVPSLICKECFLADKEGRKKLGRDVRCDLCVEQNIRSKRDVREKDEREIREYESKMFQKGLLQPNKTAVPNPGNVTRLFLKNMCRKRMDDATLLEALPGITHIVWRTDRKSGAFLGSGWVEMATPDDAARAVAQDQKLVLFGRPMGISFQAPDGKDAWPPPNSAV
ncbi:rhodanase domain containing protein [Nitzschia inconspicua]|uniref:Rhodanase domain containing protein n=1 Tax=Nitzschia inconspicua TaxID=303405 RepID=A0A9K3PCS9_9STRA|nr:rhodanase domain containing protein [Nitzschia inconspicua]